MTADAIVRNPEHSFGRRVRQARMEAHLTIAALAHLMNVDPRTVAGWQANRSRPSYERLALLARILNKPPSYFLDEEEA